MHAIVFDSSYSTIGHNKEAIALKIAYLLCDCAITTGDTGYYIVADNFLGTLSISEKIEMLFSYYDGDPDSLEYLQNTKKLLKQLAKVKHKDRNQLIAQKLCEKDLLENWDLALESYCGQMDKCGFHQLQQLRREDAIRFYAMQRKAEEPAKLYITASDLLKLYLFDIDETYEEDTTQLFFLAADFSKEGQPAPVIYSATDEEARNMGNSYLQKVFTLPFINDLSTAELQMIRRQLNTDGANFRQQADEWIQACYNGEDTEERMDLFIQQLMPAAAQVQQKIESNETLHLHDKKYDASSRLEVWMGELPVWQLWQYYKDYKVIGEDTWQKLEEAKEDEEYKDQRWPVMMLKMFEPDTSGEQEEEIKSSKKYLRID